MQKSMNLHYTYNNTTARKIIREGNVHYCDRFASNYQKQHFLHSAAISDDTKVY